MMEKKRMMKTMDGNTAAAYISYAFTDVAAIFPITPSSDMAEHVDTWAASGKKNIFNQTVKVVEMQSEGGAAGAVHGSLQAGALTTTYTASQGLLLMIPNMYKIAGELLPGVFHVSSRVVGSNAISIFGDHSDVMATRQTGFAMLAESSVQEVMDLAAVAHLAAIKSSIPFLNFFDGFRTSHEIQKIEVLEYDELANLLDMEAVNKFRRKALNPDHPVLRGTVQNSDINFQHRESLNKYYETLPETVEQYMQEINKLTGRNYQLFNYHGAPDADRVIIAMGSMCETIAETVDYLNNNGEKVGLLTVHLYRPFSIKHFLQQIPETVTKIAVLDRTKEIGSLAEPLYLDVKSAFYNATVKPVIVGGRCGVGGKNVTPTHIKGVFDNLKASEPKDNFTVGIIDDVTYSSLPQAEDIDTTPASTKACKFWGLGSDGTVGANKNAIKIIGDHTDMYAQAYFAYDSKKSGGITISHLRFGAQPIKSPYLVDKADFIACHNQSYVHNYDVLEGLKPSGNFLLNCLWTEEELDAELPASMKKYLAQNNINFYIIDAVEIAEEIGLGGRINMIMQSAFFKIADIIPIADAVAYLKQAVEKSYGHKGEHIVKMNNAAIDHGLKSLVKVEIPAEWAQATEDETVAVSKNPEFIDNILIPMTRQEGDKLPVSAFVGMEDGTFPFGSAAYEKRGIAIHVPKWNVDKCIQCNQCSYVCPHASIRPILLNDEEVNSAPEGLVCKKAIGTDNLQYHMAISPLDCTGCGNCAQICPAKESALTMESITSQMDKVAIWDYVMTITPKENPANKFTVKGSQFEQPLLEFSGACAGCVQTPYAKLITQLFGDRMMIANATGCSSVWAGSAPAVPYTTNHKGHGPAWANSLFEDNAEFGLGMHIAANQIREQLAMKVKSLISANLNTAITEKCQAWLANINKAEQTRALADNLIAVLKETTLNNPDIEFILENSDFLVKRSQWLFGGDGWAYDIGFSGLDHALASGEDINVMVFDTEIYSNTGGQASKATPAAAIAKFAASGKNTKKKDLGMMAMSYGYVYVAQIAMGADKNQTIKAIQEAEAYPGPSLIIAYAPCISHGIKNGMGTSHLEAKKAVECGYWSMFRYNPQLKDAGKNPFILDSKTPTEDFNEFLMGEVRFSSLKKRFPETAEALFNKTKQDAFERLENYEKLAKQ